MTTPKRECAHLIYEGSRHWRPCHNQVTRYLPGRDGLRPIYLCAVHAKDWTTVPISEAPKEATK